MRGSEPGGQETRRDLMKWLLMSGVIGLTGCGRARTDRGVQQSLDSWKCLDHKQLGHLQHIKNLAGRQDGDWSLMGSSDPEQAGLSSYRYQLAYMAYTLGVAHYHHLPAAPGVFKSAYENIMRKMLRYDVWSYWYDTSRSGPRLDPDLKELRTPWRDPVLKENIMYSGHVLAMAGLYEMLFGDDRYSRDGGLTFEHTPMFWGEKTFSYEYSFTSLKNAVFLQMLQSGWLGVACEPNNVFIVCNQFPMLGFRFHDACHGTSDADLATRSYQDAWERKGGFVGEDNSIISTLLVKQGLKMPSVGLDWDAWTGSVLNAWAPDYARELFAAESARYFRKHDDGRVTLYPKTVLDDVAKQRAAGEPNPALQDPTFAYRTPSFGYAAIWLSELGDHERLEGLLAHADQYMSPTWENSGLYYPRNDTSWNAEGEMTFVEPTTGNALIAYARLNPTGGLNAIYQSPWTSQHRQHPQLANDPENVFVSHATFDTATQVLNLCLEPRGSIGGDTNLRIEGVRTSDWRLVVNGQAMSAAALARQQPEGRSNARADKEGVLELSLLIRSTTKIMLLC